MKHLPMLVGFALVALVLAFGAAPAQAQYYVYRPAPVVYVNPAPVTYYAGASYSFYTPAPAVSYYTPTYAAPVYVAPSYYRVRPRYYNPSYYYTPTYSYTPGYYSYYYTPGFYRY